VTAPQIGEVTALVVSYTTPDGDVHGFTLGQMSMFMREERYAELLDDLTVACEQLLEARKAAASRLRVVKS